ncbi:MAG: cysteine hydrolase [Candidatus Omnitrophica bacterium]|nr:cysteine hydrolase [Candidatus Omnitrophota bacterium]
MRPAVLVLDMIVDFTTGRYGTAAARGIRPAVARLLAGARRMKVPVLYCQEAHTPEDPELRVWGRHGMVGTPGAKTDPALRPKAGEPVIPKHTFGGFYGTDLEDLLRERQADAVVLTGVCTDICIQHTAADAFFRGYRILVPRDGTAALTPEDHERGLRYMARTYGAKITTTDDLIRRWSSSPRKARPRPRPRARMT